MSVRMRHTKSHTANRRSHHGLTEPRLSSCSNCGGSHIRHKVCGNCGQYRGRIVIDVAAQLAKKEKKAKMLDKKVAEKKQEETTGAEESTDESKPLDLQNLSKK